MKVQPVYDLALLSVTHLVVDVFAQMHIALIPVFILDFDLSLFSAGVIAMIFPVTYSVSVIPCGMLADKINRRILVVTGLFVAGVSALIAGSSTNVYLLSISLSTLGLSSTLYHPPGLSVVSDLFAGSKRSRAMGLHGAAGTTGIAIGPFSLGLFMPSFGWRFVYLAWGVSALLLVPLISFGLKSVGRSVGRPNSDPSRTHVFTQSSLFSMGFLVLLAVISIRALGNGAVTTYLTSYLVSVRDATPSDASLILSLISTVGILGTASGGVLASRFGDKRWFSVACLFAWLSLLGIAAVRPMVGMILFIVLYGYFNSSVWGPARSMVAQFTPSKRWGVTYALFFLSESLPAAISSVVGGAVAENFGIWNIFPLGLIILAVAICLVLFMPGLSEK